MALVAAPMKTNRLAREKSPYLLQHAHNPVDWHAWGPEAIEKARKEGKPILLSVGYSTCHWCHVMERESFEDPAIAEVMNRHFVSIKLDREERPDLDKVYMTAVQAMTGQGGWPLNVFLTPDLKPFFGGTYFPPRARWGRPGWIELLERIAELWKTKRPALEEDAGKLSEALTGWLVKAAPPSKLDAAWLDKAFESLEASFDPERGGFGGAPKFPMPATLSFLLRYHARAGKPAALEMVLKTLREMVRGGIYDQLGGGFHRYSTDAAWRVPHFEKMLYDNAQLAAVLVEAYQASRDESLAAAARGTLDYALRDLATPEGGFSSAEDADSAPAEGGEKSEGAFYLWTAAEVEALLGEDAPAVISRYGIEKDGNAPEDPHGEFTGKNILYDAQGPERSGEDSLAATRKKLLAARAERTRPDLDTKILTSWNGLMISALAKGGAALGEPRYLAAAAKAARFIKGKLYDAKARRLYHRWRDGERAVPGQADDYAFLIQGLLDLYEASFELDWLDWAEELSREQARLFASESGGLYLTAEGDDPHLLLRVIDDSDGVEPAASSVAALNGLRLAQLRGSDEHRRNAQRLLEGFASRLSERPSSLSLMLCAVDFALAKPRQVVLAAEAGDAGLAPLLREVNARFLPVKALLLADAAAKKRLGAALPFLKGIVPLKDRPAAYVCVDYACRLPTADPKALGRLLDGLEAP